MFGHRTGSAAGGSGEAEVSSSPEDVTINNYYASDHDRETADQSIDAGAQIDRDADLADDDDDYMI
jgi:hypothetical protein